MHQVLCKPSKLDPERRYTNFVVRYKWAFAPQYDNIETVDTMSPDFKAYLRLERAVLKFGSVSCWWLLVVRFN